MIIAPISAADVWLRSFQCEDGSGPSIAQQLAMNPFQVVIESDAVKVEFGGYGMSAVHTSQMVRPLIHLHSVCAAALLVHTVLLFSVFPLDG